MTVTRDCDINNMNNYVASAAADLPQANAKHTNMHAWCTRFAIFCLLTLGLGLGPPISSPSDSCESYCKLFGNMFSTKGTAEPEILCSEIQMWREQERMHRRVQQAMPQCEAQGYSTPFCLFLFRKDTQKFSTWLDTWHCHSLLPTPPTLQPP